MFGLLSSFRTVFKNGSLYITTSNTWVLEFLHLFINTSYSYLFILDILVCVKYILIVLLIFISLITKIVEYVFICLLSLCISSLEKSLFQFFAYLSFCHGPIGLWPLLWLYLTLITIKNPGFPGGSGGKKSACNAGDQGSVPELGRYAGEANGYPLQYSCLENSMDRGAWWAIVDGVAKSQTQVSNYAFAIKDPISRYNHIGDWDFNIWIWEEHNLIQNNHTVLITVVL